jgi:hypothetical protein
VAAVGRKVLLFELNEVPLRIVDEFCAKHPDSVLASLLPACWQFETWTEDGNLSPWTTWPTLHRGVHDREHTIHHFGQDLREIDRAFPPLWQILSRQGVRTGVCGSLHSYPPPRELGGHAFYLPDTFATGSECFPGRLRRFQDFNLAMARDSARVVGEGIHWRAALRMVAAAPRLGFTTDTVADVVAHLAAERVRPWKRIRRRTFQAVLTFDLFMREVQRGRPDFATFFTNHVASSMHRYWAATFPGDYERFEFDGSWVARYRNEIAFTMSRFDRFLARLVRFVHATKDYVLWVTTSMGQAATVAREVETKLMLSDPRRFMSRLGLQPGEWSQKPAMVPQTNVILHDGGAAARFRRALSGVVVGLRPLEFSEREGGFFSVTIGHENVDPASPGVLVQGRPASLGELGLVIQRIDDKCGATAYHVPRGTMLVYDPRRRPGWGQGRATISTLDVAPTLLRHFGLGVPEYMKGGRCSALQQAVTAD